VLTGVTAGAAALALAAIGPRGPALGTAAPKPSAPPAVSPRVASPTAGGVAVASPAPGGLVGYAFNAKTKDVTLFDPATLRVVATEPLGVVVRWLSNEQRFWDGRYVWAYDFPDDLVRAIAIDPRAPAVVRTLPTGGAGPAHSLVLTADGTEAWVNVAGDDVLTVLDLGSGEVAAEVKTGAFP
jgi:hypothetical protein